MKGEKEYDTSYRIITPNGKIKFIKAHGRITRSSEGNPIRLTGINYDITAQSETEEKINIQLEELRRWYDVTLGREDRIIQLKHEVNNLREQLKEPHAYLSRIPENGKYKVSDIQEGDENE